MLSKVCCFRLQTAGIIVGWLGVVGSAITTILFSVALTRSDTIATNIVQMTKDQTITFESVHTAVIIFCSILLGIAVLNLVTSGMLVLGTMKERHLMLVPWLIHSAIVLAISSLYNLAVLRAVFISPEHVFFFIWSVFILALQMYIYYGIYSLFKEIQHSRDQQLPLLTKQPQYAAVTHKRYNTYTKM